MKETSGVLSFGSFFFEVRYFSVKKNIFVELLFFESQHYLFPMGKQLKPVFLIHLN
jgi:hypothetical protein